MVFSIPINNETIRIFILVGEVKNDTRAEKEKPNEPSSLVSVKA